MSKPDRPLQAILLGSPGDHQDLIGSFKVGCFFYSTQKDACLDVAQHFDNVMMTWASAKQGVYQG